MQDVHDVILVGLTRTSAAVKLRRKLETSGLRISEIASPDRIPKLLRRMPKATIVVYSPDRGPTAHDTLEAVASANRSAPVVVLVDRSDFGDYYALMSEGALEYYELSERPEIIARGVGWAARAHAA